MFLQTIHILNALPGLKIGQLLILHSIRKVLFVLLDQLNMTDSQ